MAVDPKKFIQMGVKNGVPQYVEKTSELDATLKAKAGGPLGTMGANNLYDGVWDQASLAAAGNPAGQTSGQAATGNYANRAAAQNSFYNMTMAAQSEINKPGEEDPVTEPPGTTNPATPNPATGGANTWTPPIQGGTYPGALPEVGDYTTPPPTNASVNQPLTNISQVMQNNSRVPGSAGASTGGVQNSQALGRPVTSGSTASTKTPKTRGVNLGADTTGASGKLDSIQKVGIRF
jgi:hypothetical protein